MSDLLLFGPILFLGLFGWIASVASLRSTQRLRAAMQHEPRPAGRLSSLSGTTE